MSSSVQRRPFAFHKDPKCHRGYGVVVYARNKTQAKAWLVACGHKSMTFIGETNPPAVPGWIGSICPADFMSPR